ERAVHEYGRLGLLERARQRDADVRVLALAGAVDDAAHDRDLQLFHARVLRLPHRHLLAEVGLDLLGHLLEDARGSAPDVGSSRDAADSRSGARASGTRRPSPGRPRPWPRG